MREYLPALVDGDAEKAVRMSDPGVPSDERSLLTNKVYQAATKRVDGYTILSTDIQDNTATVMAEVSQDGRKHAMPYTLVKGNATTLDDDWKLKSRLRTTVVVTADSNVAAFAVNAVTIDSPVGSAGTSITTLPAFPGEYTIGIPTTEKYITAQEMPALVAVDPGSSPKVTKLEVSPTEELETAVAAKIEAVWSTCAASTSLDPADCPFRAFAFGDVRGISWSVKDKPQYELDNSFGEEWRIVTKKSGTAEVSFEQNASFNRDSPEWKKETKPVPFRASGTVQVESGEVTLKLSRY